MTEGRWRWHPDACS